MSSCLNAAPTPLPPRRWLRVQVGLGALGVAGLGDGDHHLLTGDQVLVGHQPSAATMRYAGRRRASRRSPSSSSRTMMRCRSGQPGCPRGRRSRPRSWPGSSMIFCRSRPARRRTSCMSRMAWAWISSMSSSSIRWRAMSTVSDAGSGRSPRRGRRERLDQTAGMWAPFVGLAQPVGGPPDDDVEVGD